jgi:DNA-binding CsgD family transcriptional regulator
MDLSGSVSSADLAVVLDAAARVADAAQGDDAVQALFVALVRLVGIDLTVRLWTDVAAADGLPRSGSPVLPGRVSADRTVVLPVGEPGGPPHPDVDDRDQVVLRLLRPHVEAALRRPTRPPPSLTPREKQVLLLVRDGLGNAAIARTLGVAESTVVKHLEHVYARIGAHSRTQALHLCGPALD